MDRMDRAKELFLKYSGNRFYMDLNGEGHEYAGYDVSKETEEAWAREYISRFFESEKQGKEALNAYSSVTVFLKSGRYNEDLKRGLYYPLRSEHLDDVTILFMLKISYSLAESMAKKRILSRMEKNEYLKELDSYSLKALERMEKGSLTRADDYVMNEFSDPDYVKGYLNDLRKKWKGL